MKNYRLLSKIGLAVCALGALAVAVNYFTGFINAVMPASSSLICILGFGLAGMWNVLFEKKPAKTKK